MGTPRVPATLPGGEAGACFPGAHYVFDTAFSRNFSLLESQREFVRRFRGQADSKQALPVLTSACPGVLMLLRDTGGCTCVGDAGGSRRALPEQARNAGPEWPLLREKLPCITCGRFSSLRWRSHACQTHVTGTREWEGSLMGPSSWYKLVHPQTAMSPLSQWEAVCDHPVCSMLVSGWICYAEKTHGTLLIPHLSTARSPQQVMGSLVKDFFAQQQVTAVFPPGMTQCPCLER